MARMALEARRAAAVMPAQGPWRSLASLIEGSSLACSGLHDEAAVRLGDGAREGVFEAPLVRSLCLAELALLELQHGDAEDAAALAGRARGTLSRGGCDREPMAALTFAVAALAHSVRGDHDAARDDLAKATALLVELPDPPPWYGAVVRVVLARVQLRLSAAAEGRRLLSEASRLCRQAGGAIALKGWIDDAWQLADDFACGPVAHPATLTMAELRVMRLLPSHLTFREIAARLHVSSNTVKTQAHAVYRKLDARSRSEAVAHATAIGLVDAQITRSG
jgi:LuxR family transcriptional regulator, maltose regulon positive regulatory protein